MNNQNIEDEVNKKIEKIYNELESDSTFQKEKIRILYLDDEIKNLTSFKSLLRREYDISIAVSAEEAYEILKNKEFHIIMTDQRMPKITGTQFLKSIVDKYPKPIRIIISGYAEIQDIKDSINKGHTCRFVTKPWELEEMKQTIETAYEMLFLREQNQLLMDQMGKANVQLEQLLHYKSNNKMG